MIDELAKCSNSGHRVILAGQIELYFILNHLIHTTVVWLQYAVERGLYSSILR